VIAREGRASLRSIAYHAGLTLFILVMIYPLLWMAASSIKSPEEIWTRATSLIPRRPTFVNYANGWKGFGEFSFADFYMNSVIYAGLTMMLPVQILIIPQYILFSQLGWINTFLPLLVPPLLCQAGQAFFIFMLVQFIRGIPSDLDEAAEIDGAGRLRIFFTMIVPLIKPAMVTTAIFSFYWTWSEFLTPLLYLNNPRLYTVSVALRSFADPAGATDWGAVFAMSFLSLIPVLAVFAAAQRYIVEGIATTGMKG
jgi:multiple sugar transport system permease protein